MDRWFSTTEEKLPLPPAPPGVDPIRLAQEIEAIEGDIRARFAAMIDTLTGRAEVLAVKVREWRDTQPRDFLPDARVVPQGFIESLMHEYLAGAGRRRAHEMIGLFHEAVRERDASEPARIRAESEWREREHARAVAESLLPDE